MDRLRLDYFVRQTAAQQELSDGQRQQLCDAASRIQPGDAQPVFLHICGRASPNKNDFCTKLREAATLNDRRLELLIVGDDDWIHEIFRHACRGASYGGAQVRLDRKYTILFVAEIRQSMSITADMYESIKAGLPVELTWVGARIPRFVKEALAGVPGAVVFEPAIAQLGTPYVRATFQLPRVVFFEGNDRPQLDAMHLPDGERRRQIVDTPIEFL